MDEKKIRAMFEAALERAKHAQESPHWCREHGAIFASGKHKEFVVIIALEGAASVLFKKVVECKNEMCPSAKLITKLGKDETVN